MNRAWAGLLRRKQIAAYDADGNRLFWVDKVKRERRAYRSLDSVLGWIRATEITQGADGSAHPHFHSLLALHPNYFKGHRHINQASWREAWRKALRVDYSPVVDVRKVRGATEGAIAEVLKYATKPVTLTDADWLLALTRQLRRRRLVAADGVLREALRPEDESQEEPALLDSDSAGETTGELLAAFTWKPPHYKRDLGADRPDEWRDPGVAILRLGRPLSGGLPKRIRAEGAPLRSTHQKSHIFVSRLAKIKFLRYAPDTTQQT